MQKEVKNRKPGVRTKLFIADETIGIGKIELLEALDNTGSISAAAAQMGMDYRRAWFLLHSTQAGFNAPLFHTKRGGAQKGGATLTALGKELIARYYATKSMVDTHSAALLKWLEQYQADPETAQKSQNKVLQEQS